MLYNLFMVYRVRYPLIRTSLKKNSDWSHSRIVTKINVDIDQCEWIKKTYHQWMQKDRGKNFRKNSRNGGYFATTHGTKYEIGKRSRRGFELTPIWWSLIGWERHLDRNLILEAMTSKKCQPAALEPKIVNRSGLSGDSHFSGWDAGIRRTIFVHTNEVF